jgi:hypothetical protein
LTQVIVQKVPLYFKQPGDGIRPGRVERESVNRPVSCGGALGVPNDVGVPAKNCDRSAKPTCRAGRRDVKCRAEESPGRRTRRQVLRKLRGWHGHSLPAAAGASAWPCISAKKATRPRTSA